MDEIALKCEQYTTRTMQHNTTPGRVERGGRGGVGVESTPSPAHAHKHGPAATLSQREHVTLPPVTPQNVIRVFFTRIVLHICIILRGDGPPATGRWLAGCRWLAGRPWRGPGACPIVGVRSAKRQVPAGPPAGLRSQWPRRAAAKRRGLRVAPRGGPGAHLGEQGLGYAPPRPAPTWTRSDAATRPDRPEDGLCQRN